MKTISIAPKKWKQITVKRVGLAGLKKELAEFEKKYGMSTQTFLQKIERRELDECNDFIDWLGLAEGYRQITVRAKSDF